MGLTRPWLLGRYKLKVVIDILRCDSKSVTYDRFKVEATFFNPGPAFKKKKINLNKTLKKKKSRGYITVNIFSTEIKIT